MIFLKSLIFIAYNIALGMLFLLALRWFLFNARERRFLGVKVPLTPGFLVRKRDWLFTKARDILLDYLNQAGREDLKTGYLHKWEEQVRTAVWDQTIFIDEWPILPQGLKTKLHGAVSSAAKSIASKVLRKTVPHFIEQWRLEHRIDEFDEKFSVEFIYKYFRQYVFKPLVYAFLAINFIIGIENMILYLILV